MSGEMSHGWANRETWAFQMILNNDERLQRDLHGSARNLRTWKRDAHPRWIGEQLVRVYREWALANYADDSDARTLVREVGSFWRIDELEIGEAVLRDLAETEAVETR